MLATSNPAPLVRLSPHLPALFVADVKAEQRFFEFFTTHLANDHTRKAYLNAVKSFAALCDLQGLRELAHVQPIHVAAYIQTIKSQGSRLRRDTH